MWIFNGRNVRQEDFYLSYRKYYDRCFYIEPVYHRDIAGRISKALSRCEIHESWSSCEQPDEHGRCMRNDKDVAVLAFSSWEEAEDFLRVLAWVLNAPSQISFTEILSTDLMETIKHANPEELYALAAKEQEELQANLNTERGGTHVYILQMDNGTVKIGMSANIRNRIAAIISHSGLEVLKWCCTGGFPTVEARYIELNCHNFFHDKRKRGEFFKIDYEEAKKFLQGYAPIIYERTILQ